MIDDSCRNNAKTGKCDVCQQATQGIFNVRQAFSFIHSQHYNHMIFRPFPTQVAHDISKKLKQKARAT